MTRQKLIKAGEGGVLAAILPKGMRAISTRIKEETAAGRLILPNDHVDVILTRRLRGPGGQEQHVSDTLFRNVRVLAIGQQIETKEGKKAAEGAANTATLELTPSQAEMLARANSMGEISLSLRSIADADKDGPDSDADPFIARAQQLRASSQIRRSDARVRRELSAVIQFQLSKRYSIMRTTLKWARAGMAAVIFVGHGPTGYAQARLQDRNRQARQRICRSSAIRCCAFLPTPRFRCQSASTWASAARSSSQFPIPLKDVLVSDPQLMDAVVQSSDRVFLIAKKSGQTNAFFFDEYGQQILTLEVAVGADLSALDELLARLIPGSSIHSEIAGKAIMLTGSVRTPIDSDRAAQIAAQFVAANDGAIGAVNIGARRATSSNSTTTNTPSNFGAGGANCGLSERRRNPTGGGSDSGSDDPYAAKPIINLLAVEGEEQVMLRVSVAEVQRSMLKQFGINVGALDQLGQLHHGGPDRQRLPADDGCRPRHAADRRQSCGRQRAQSFQYRAPGTGLSRCGAARAFGNSGVAAGWANGNQAVAGALRALERDGLLADAGRAEPDGGLGRAGQVPGGRRVSRSPWSTASGRSASPTRSTASASSSRRSCCRKAASASRSRAR